MLHITFWKGHHDVRHFEFESEAAALDFVRRVVADPACCDFDGWSLADEHHRWIYEEGEKLIPVKAA